MIIQNMYTCRILCFLMTILIMLPRSDFKRSGAWNFDFNFFNFLASSEWCLTGL